MQSNTSFSAYAISEALNNKNKIKPLEENKNPKSEERKKMLPKKKKTKRKERNDSVGVCVGVVGLLCR